MLRSMILTSIAGLAHLSPLSYGGPTYEDEFFANPSISSRPRFRYIVPESSVSLNALAEDIKAMKDVHTGGIELLTYPGGSSPPIDWVKYGWGGTSWKAMFKHALRTVKDHNLIVDFMIGPFQGAGVPARPDDDGIMWDLLAYNASWPLGGSFDGQLPGWGSGEFVAASIGLVTDQDNVTLTASPSYAAAIDFNGTRYTLAHDALQDVTHRVSANGFISIPASSDVDGLEHQVFAFYQVRSPHYETQPPALQQSSVAQSPITSYKQNGSRIADHFSEKGANLIIDFWESEILDDEMRQLLAEIGNYAWEDSYEIAAGVHIWYTPRLLDEFARRTGYSLVPYLPLLYSENAGFNAPLASINQYFTDKPDGRVSILQDYRNTLTDLQADYLRTLKTWSASLGLEFSTQVGYNLPLDMLALIPEVDAPESESLGFLNNIDLYRQYAGPANFAGKRIISNEMGAVSGKAYSQTMPELLWSTKRAFAGNHNNMILHVYPWAHEYYNTTWPGYTVFLYLFSASHGPRQPSWEFYADFMDWMGRMQYVTQKGTPKVDVAFWLKTEFQSVQQQYGATDLENAGYTYEYLSPNNFALPDAVVEEHFLAPTRQAFKALVIRNNSTLTQSGIAKAVQFANVGLPIVFLGGLPSNFSGVISPSGKSESLAALRCITSLDNVRVTNSSEGLAQTLTSLGIPPRVQIEADRVWYTNYWSDGESGKTYVTVYNDAQGLPLGAGHSKGSIEVAAPGAPYLYNAWTGNVAPMARYACNGANTILDLALRGNESAVLVFDQDRQRSCQPAPYDSVKAQPFTPAPILDPIASFSVAKTPAIRAFDDATAYELTNWTLVVEAWLPPADFQLSNATQGQLGDALYTAEKQNSSFQLQTLQSWNDISESLRNVSGRGYYSTSFTWPGQNAGAEGVVLDLGALPDLTRAFLNGIQLPALDPTRAVADLGPHLSQGSNELEIVLTTTLSNSLRPVWEELLTGGVSPMGAVPPEEAYGLVIPVVLRPYTFESEVE